MRTRLSCFFYTWPSAAARIQSKDIVVNIAIYLPLGLFGLLGLSRRRSQAIRIALPIVFGFALSCCIEMFQLFDARRTTSAVDVLTNTAGSALGALSAVFFETSPAFYAIAPSRLSAPPVQFGGAPALPRRLSPVPVFSRFQSVSGNTQRSLYVWRR